MGTLRYPQFFGDRRSYFLRSVLRRQTARGALASIDPTTPATKRGSKGGRVPVGREFDPSGVIAGRKQPDGPVAAAKIRKTTPGGGETRTGVTSGPPTPRRSQLGQRQRRCRKSRADGLKDVGDAQPPLEGRSGVKKSTKAQTI